MKKIFLTLIFLVMVLLKNTSAQSNIIGEYSRANGIIWIQDSSFFFVRKGDLYRAWAKGTWIVKGDRIFFKVVPIFDTLSVLTSSGGYRDSLILSPDVNPERVIKKEQGEYAFITVEQKPKDCPRELIFREDKLYVIKKGKRLTKKITDNIYVVPFNPWYEKQPATPK